MTKLEEMTTELDIELADNGIIIRDPNERDNVQVYQFGEDNNDDAACLAVGRIIYKWLIHDVMGENYKRIIAEGFNIHIKANLFGRLSQEAIEEQNLNSIKLHDTPLKVRTIRIMENNNIETIGDLIKLSKMDVLKMRGAGKTTLEDLTNLLKLCNLSFKYSE